MGPHNQEGADVLVRVSAVLWGAWGRVRKTRSCPVRRSVSPKSSRAASSEAPLRPGASCWRDDRPNSQDASFILERCLCPRLSLAPTSGYGACNCRAPDSETVLRISGLRDPKTALPEFVPVPHVAQSQHLPSTHRTQLRDAQAGRLRLLAPSLAHLAGGNPITFPSPGSTNSCIASTACQCAASWMNLADECVEIPNDRATRSSPLPQRPRRAPVVGHRCRVGMGEAPPSHRHARDLAIGRA